MIYRLYINTSVFGTLFDNEDAARVRITRRLLDMLAADRYEGYIGREVLAEINLAPVRIRDRLLKAVAWSESAWFTQLTSGLGTI